ncbi:aminotransferase class IV [Sulfurovum sp.]|uniref:aminotransferase class IV n=1 Tax=Sulfurovum sp. TaxID=1969726 RepID=UPI0025D6CA81|nr:aminotransferase class IV [Sulfurovum sp.]
MPLLLETIKIEDGDIHDLSYHQTRCDRSRHELFGSIDTLDLLSAIQAPTKGIYRCRILYNENIHSIDYLPYTAKEIHTLKVIPSNIVYDYKYANREALDTLLQMHSDVDEVIIEKEGYLTDTTIANIAFYNGKQWITPARPLLEGTMRAKLLEEGFLHKKEIKKEDLKTYTHVALMNAMLGFKILNHFKIKT